MLIVDDDPNTVPKNLGLISCPQNCENDITIVMQEFRYGHIPGGAHADHGGGHGAHAGPYSALQRSIRDYEGFRWGFPLRYLSASSKIILSPKDRALAETRLISLIRLFTVR